MLRIAAHILAFWCLLCAPAFAALTLDKLNACDDIATTWRLLSQQSPEVRSQCRAPHGRIEQAFYDRSAPEARAQVCFLSRAPAGFVAGFDCFTRFIDGSAELHCIRARPDVDLDAYFASYAAHPEIEQTYFASARACPTSNDDAGVAPRTTFSAPLLLVARHGLGFYASIGQGITTNSLVWHGYARLDPAIGGGAVEIVYMLIAAQTPSAVAPSPIESQSGQAIGPWRVRIDEAEAFERDAERALARTNPGDYYIDWTSFEVARVWTAAELARSAASLEERRRQMGDWQAAAVASLESQGLRAVSDDELRAQSGVGVEDMRRQWLASAALPYGMRDEVAVQLSEYFTVLLTEDAPCASAGQPMMALVAGVQPAQANSRDYGGLVVLMIATCGTRRSTHRMFDEVSAALRTDMIEVWEER
jgi:hypothetical protein